MAPYWYHIFVCCNQRPDGHPRGCCDPEGKAALQQALKAELGRCGLTGRVRANKAGCLDQCELGPVIVIYPQGIWYGGVRVEDVPRIVQQTILRGRVLEDLVIPPEVINNPSARRQWRAARDARTGQGPCASSS